MKHQVRLKRRTRRLVVGIVSQLFRARDKNLSGHGSSVFTADSNDGNASQLWDDWRRDGHDRVRRRRRGRRRRRDIRSSSSRYPFFRPGTDARMMNGKKSEGGGILLPSSETTQRRRRRRRQRRATGRRSAKTRLTLAVVMVNRFHFFTRKSRFFLCVFPNCFQRSFLSHFL